MDIFNFFLSFIEKTYDFYFLQLDSILEAFYITILISGSVILIELFFVGWKNSSLKRLFKPSESTLIDVFSFLLYSTSLIIIIAAILSLGIPYFAKTLFFSETLFEAGEYLPIWVHLFLYLIILDFIHYWQHRLMHRVSPLWEIHKFHHSAKEMNVITVYREHPLDKALLALTSVIPIFLLGRPVGDFIVFFAFYNSIGFFKHSRLPWTLGWFGKYIIQSPRDHWIHHSKSREHHDKNFANNFAIWDHIFGTYYNGDNQNAELGLNKNNLNQNYIRDLWIVQKSFFLKLIKIFR